MKHNFIICLAAEEAPMEIEEAASAASWQQVIGPAWQMSPSAIAVLIISFNCVLVGRVTKKKVRSECECVRVCVEIFA